MELLSYPSRSSLMSDGVDKLRQLARQTRALSRENPDRQRAMLLRGLAQLYDEQAAQLEGESPERLSVTEFVS